MGNSHQNLTLVRDGTQKQIVIINDDWGHQAINLIIIEARVRGNKEIAKVVTKHSKVTTFTLTSKSKGHIYWAVR